MKKLQLRQLIRGLIKESVNEATTNPSWYNSFEEQLADKLNIKASRSPFNKGRRRFFSRRFR